MRVTYVLQNMLRKTDNTGVDAMTYSGMSDVFLVCQQPVTSSCSVIARRSASRPQVQDPEEISRKSSTTTGSVQCATS